MPGPITPEFYEPPHGHPLQPYVLRIFRSRWNGAGTRETILPKGNVDFLFNLGGRLHGAAPCVAPFVAAEGSTWISGLRTAPYVVRPEAGVHLVGVSLRAEGSAALLPVSPAELLNQELAGADLPAELRALGEQVHAAAGFGAQCELLMQWLLRRLRPPSGAPLVRHACTLLRTSPAEEAVGATAKALAVSPRHLRRLVTEHVGVGPAEYVRVARFVRATRLIADPALTLGQVAHGAGYFDQPHLCRDFRAFGGMSPRAFRAGISVVPGHVFSTDGRSVQDGSP